MKKFPALFLSFIMLMSCFSMSAYAADEAPASGTCGDGLTWNLSTKGVLTIDGDGSMDDYMNRTYAPWYQSYASIKSVTFTGSVSNIGDYAFTGCEKLNSVTLSDSITVIGDHAFENCGNIKEITFPDGLTSIGNHAFENDVWLNNVVIPDGAASIGEGAFVFCAALTDITVPDSVNSIGKDAFYGCDKLKEINIPEGVTEIGEETFYKCTSLESITLPASLTAIGNYAFTYCTSLTSVNIPAGVSSIGTGAFSDCTAVETITVDSANKTFDSRDNCNACIETATDTLVFGCKNTVIPNDIDVIGDSAFRGCTGLTSVVIPNGCRIISPYAFCACDFGSIALPESIKSIGFDAFGLWGTDTLEVNYYGKEADKAGIIIDKGNDILTASGWNYLSNPKINVAAETSVNYKSNVVIEATGTDIPEGMHLVMFIDGKQVAEGTGTAVSCEVYGVTSDISYTVKAVDGSGNVQQDAFGADLVKDGGMITCKTGFFAKLIAFFRTLFNRPLAVTVKP